jgi:flagellar basal body rod protein FlgG
MKNSIYSTAAGMLTSLARLDIATNNLVNIGSTGYKSDISFEQTLRNLSGGPFPGKDQPVLGGNAIDMKNGIIQTTGRDLDLAFEGPGFFAVLGPNNQELYTRNGEFELNSNKELVNADGYNILDKFNKKITVIGEKFQFSPSGELFIDGAYYTTLKIVDIPNRDNLEKIGGTFFKLKDNAPQPQPIETPQIAVGALEKSNADLLLEAANISNTQRTFDAQKAVADVVLNSLRKVITEIPRPI